MHDIAVIRNIGIVAHIDAGKTTTSERILYYSGKSYKVGEVHEGTAQMDWMLQEQERGITITSAATTCEWVLGGKEYQVNLIDTPGHVDFTIEVERSLRVLDGAVVVVCGVSGVQSQTETIWRQTEAYEIPKLLFVNKLDRLGADFEEAVSSVETKFSIKAIPITYPYFESGDLKGVIDVVDEVLVLYEENGYGSAFVVQELVGDEKRRNVLRKECLIECLCDLDDSLADRYLSGVLISAEELKVLIKKYVGERAMLPVFCGSAFKNKGVQKLLDGVCSYLPSPLDRTVTLVDTDEGGGAGFDRPLLVDDSGPLVALVFKVFNDDYAGYLFYVKIYSGTLKVGQQYFNSSKGKKERPTKLFKMHSNRREEVKECRAGDLCACVGLSFSETGDTICDSGKYFLLRSIASVEPVISSAVEAKNNDEMQKMHVSLKKIEREDPSFRFFLDEETGQAVISGMGELHLEVVQDRLAKEFGVQVSLGKPRVAYRESVNDEGQAFEHINRSVEGKDVDLKIVFKVSPLTAGVDNVVLVDNVLVKEDELFRSSIEEGAIEALKNGAISGYPLIKVKAELLEFIFDQNNFPLSVLKFGAALCVKKAVQAADPVLLEPVMNVEVVCPIECTGDVIGDLNSRNGKIQSVLEKKELNIVESAVRLSHMFGYSTQLRSATKGRAVFSMKFDHYSPTIL